MKHFLKVEPVAITALVAAVLGLLLILNVISDEVAGALGILLGAVLVVVRQMVTPVEGTG